MIRRWASLLVIWASLLGVAAPTIACAIKTQDCCPVGSPSPCQEADSSGVGVLASITCCSATPAANSLAIADSVRVRLKIHVPSSPDPVVSTAWVPSIHLTALARGSPPPLLISFRENDSLTYLRTARLRI